MLAIRISYAPGVFHEAPWIRPLAHAVEWPPSPFSLLAVIVAAWMRSGDENVERLQRLCDLLAEIPSYNLPPETLSHSRHYSHTDPVNDGSADTSAILDTFGVLSSNSAASVSAFVIWQDVRMHGEDAAALELILSNVRDFKGSRCAFSIASELPAERDRIEVATSIRNRAGPAVWRVAAHPMLRGVRLLKALFREANLAGKGGRIVPNDTILVGYRFPPQFGLDSQDALARDRARSDLPPRIERFMLTPLTGRDRPWITDAIVISEAMRWASMRASSALERRVADPVLTGKAPNGLPSAGHGHAFFLPIDIDGDGRIDYIDIWYPTGSSVETHRATVAARHLYDDRIDGGLYVDYLGPIESVGATRWRSSTPFVLERHVKTAGRSSLQVKSGAPADQVRVSLFNHGTKATPSEIIVDAHRALAVTPDGRRLSAASFRRSRLRETHAMPAYSVELGFDSLVRGPIVAGKHAHFGLGQFVPIL